MVCCCWDLIEEESIAAGVCVKVLVNPPMAPRKTPTAQSPAIAINMMIPIFMNIVYNKIYMKRILFLGLWSFFVLFPLDGGAVEIYINGHQYASIESYQAAKKAAKEQSPVQVNSHGLSDMVQHQLYVLSFESGMVGALQDFYQTRGQFDLQMTRRIDPEQLQAAIEQAVTGSKAPKLLISEPGKVRIMALTTGKKLDY